MSSATERKWKKGRTIKRKIGEELTFSADQFFITDKKFDMQMDSSMKDIDVFGRGIQQKSRLIFSSLLVVQALNQIKNVLFSQLNSPIEYNSVVHSLCERVTWAPAKAQRQKGGKESETEGSASTEGQEQGETRDQGQGSSGGQQGKWRKRRDRWRLRALVKGGITGSGLKHKTNYYF